MNTIHMPGFTAEEALSQSRTARDASYLHGSVGISADGVVVVQPQAQVQVQGQDKIGKKCERKEMNGTSTFGNCENVCDGKDVTRDALNNRWVCKASLVVDTSFVRRSPMTAAMLWSV